MTRRVVKPQPPREAAVVDPYNGDIEHLTAWTADGKMFLEPGNVKGTAHWRSPYGQPGDRLWVRERFQWLWATDEKPRSKDSPEGWKIGYPATDGIQEYLDHNEGILQRCAPSIHMPRWASRLTLEVTKIRVERVQKISEEDAISEGVGAGFQTNGGWPDYQHINKHGICELTQDTPELSFSTLWDSINAKRGFGWDKNPWVWVLEFKQVDA
jgi:hypothetical protein